ncbi:hypothetical protein [Helicobacter turcicus]|uniref:hypothetical protein n=1 Tax=Helicobacter turcicus TaxID=2867412 RepID=UPI001C88CC52|nr:hypothetical protein [Helicobacter turcicus]MBX7545223.1 hypothetical protein [Helicobacter turcicus]
MQTMSFVKFKTPIKVGDYLVLREILQEDIEITFVDDFYGVEFFNLLRKCAGGGHSCSF